MKRLITITIMALAAITAHADIVVLDTITLAVTAGGTKTSSAINLGTIPGRQDKRLEPRGYASAQVVVTGDGTVSLTYELSNDGTSWGATTTITIDNSAATTTIRSGMTSAGGPYLAAFSLPLAKYIRFKATETGTTDTASLAVKVAVQ